jgi:hypothetical protein
MGVELAPLRSSSSDGTDRKRRSRNRITATRPPTEKPRRGLSVKCMNGCGSKRSAGNHCQPHGHISLDGVALRLRHAPMAALGQAYTDFLYARKGREFLLLADIVAGTQRYASSRRSTELATPGASRASGRTNTRICGGRDFVAQNLDYAAEWSTSRKPYLSTSIVLITRLPSGSMRPALNFAFKIRSIFSRSASSASSPITSSR